MARDNAYYVDRLTRAGRRDLIDQINRGEISVYAATIEAGLRKRKDAPSRAGHLSHHWSRASEKEKIRFLLDNIKTVAPMMRRIAKQAKVNSEGSNS